MFISHLALFAPNNLSHFILSIFAINVMWLSNNRPARAGCNRIGEERWLFPRIHLEAIKLLVYKDVQIGSAAKL